MTEQHQIDERRIRAKRGARNICAALARRGVVARITGSLATGGFGRFSDVDFLIVRCPRAAKYTIEGLVEDELEGIGFDVLYFDELPAAERQRALSRSIDAGDLY